MFRRTFVVAALALVAPFHVPFALPARAAGDAAETLLLNKRRPLAGVLTGGATGQPEEFEALVAAGYRTFIDLRTDPEAAADSLARAVAAGLDYVRIPVQGESELDLPTVRALDAVLDDSARLPVAVACSSGNRAGALLALRAHWLDAMPAEAALALGEDAGLTRLEPSVRLLLGLPPEPRSEPAPEGETVAPSPGTGENR